MKEFAPYRCNKLWGFTKFIHDFFVIANKNKQLSRDADIDESVKKASSQKGRNIFSYYMQKNNDYGFGFFCLHGRLENPVGNFKGVGYCHNIIPEAAYEEGPWAYYGKGYDVLMQLLTGPCYYLGKGHRIGMDNRYTSCNALMFLHKNFTNAFGTVRANTKYLPDDAKEMYDETKEYNPGGFRQDFLQQQT